MTDDVNTRGKTRALQLAAWAATGDPRAIPVLPPHKARTPSRSQKFQAARRRRKIQKTSRKKNRR